MSAFGLRICRPFRIGILCTDDMRHCTKSVMSTSKFYSSLSGFPSTTLPVSSLLINYQPHRNAGHSKWANIKHVKTLNDLTKSRELAKFINYIRVAVKEHGSADPKVNSKLAGVIAQIKEAKLPMGAIDRALQSFKTTAKDNLNCIYPIKGPGSCTMLIEIESPNLAKSKQELNTILRKNKAVIAPDSTVKMFIHKGTLLSGGIDGKPASQELLDDATMHAIEVGATDVTFIEDYPDCGPVFEFITEPSTFFKVKNGLEQLKYKLDYAEVGYIPNVWIELTDRDSEAADKLFTKLIDHPDVVNVYVNIS